MNAHPSISVVIPTYQRCASVQRALETLAQQTLAPDTYEVIVAIDGSTDGTREMVEDFSAPYALQGVWQPNRGRAAACNAGIAAAQGELIVLLDDDMEAAPAFLAAHQQAHAAHDFLGVIGAAPMKMTPASPPVVRYVGAKFNQHLAKLAQPGYQLRVRDFYSGNFSIRRQHLLKVNLFDEGFKIYGNEDIDLSLRLTSAGIQLTYSAAALAYQNYTKDFAGLARDYIAKGQTSVLLARKHPAIVAELKLSTYTQASRQQRVLRAFLLGLSRYWAATPEQVINGIRRLEAWRPAQLDLYYSLALDYFYWLGVQVALRENRVSDERLAPWVWPSGKVQP